MKRVRLSEFAHNELTDACGWYERQQSGLGSRFRSDVREATRRIALSPLLFPVELDEVRRYVMNRFPYTLRYVPTRRLNESAGNADTKPRGQAMQPFAHPTTIS